MKAKSLSICAASAIGIMLTSGGVLADEVVIPNDNANSPGPSNQAFPFNAGSPMRVQQIFRADQLQGLTGAVTQIAFRVDESSGGPFTSNSIDVQVFLSHTSVDPLDMSLNYDDNHGSDLTLVLDDFVTLSSAGAGDFDIILDINDDFMYNGSDNLLVEYKVFNDARSTQFDAAGTGLGQGGLATINRVWGFDPNGASGSSNGDDGYVTQLTIEGGLSLAVRGSCPGEMSLVATGATPNVTVGFVGAYSEGMFIIPGGPCAGTMLDIGPAGIRLVGTAQADPGGTAILTGNAPRAACGRFFVQAIDANTCDTSNVEDI